MCPTAERSEGVPSVKAVDQTARPHRLFMGSFSPIVDGTIRAIAPLYCRAQLRARKTFCYTIGAKTNGNSTPKAEWTSHVKRCSTAFIGFSWNVLDWFWEQQFEALRQHKTPKGHCNVPPAQSRVLASWVTTQRLVFKAGTMLIERQVRLETVGFEWHPLDNIWNARFGQMRNYL